MVTLIKALDVHVVLTHDELSSTLNEWARLQERIKEQEEEYKELIGDQLLIMEESDEEEPREQDSDFLLNLYGALGYMVLPEAILEF